MWNGATETLPERVRRLRGAAASAVEGAVWRAGVAAGFARGGAAGAGGAGRGLDFSRQRGGGAHGARLTHETSTDTTHMTSAVKSALDTAAARLRRLLGLAIEKPLFSVFARALAHPVTNVLAFIVDNSGNFVGNRSSGKLGYTTGAGSTVTQATNRSTGVTINAVTGAITMNATSLAAGAEATFTVTNSAVEAADVPVVAIKSSATGTPVANVTAVAAGSFAITVTNLHASTADTTADVINFVVLKGATS